MTSDQKFVAKLHTNKAMAELADLHRSGQRIARHPGIERINNWCYRFHRVTGASSADCRAAFRQIFAEGKK